MFTLDAGMQTHVAGELTTLAWIAKITRTDGTIFAFTTHDVDLVVSAVTYKASPGFMGGAMRQSADFSVDNVQIIGMIDDDSITEVDLVAGLFDFAKIEIAIVNWANLTLAPIKRFKGNLGEVPKGTTQFAASLLGLGDALQDMIGKVVQPTCRHDFGDANCGANLVALAQSGTVTSIIDARRKFHASGLTGAGPRSVSYTASTISFAKPNKIKDSANGFVSAGFLAGDGISITGSDKNDTSHTVKSVAAGEIVTETATVLKEPAGASITIEASTAGYFDFGRITWTSGANNEKSIEVKSWDGTDLLELPLSAPPGGLPYDIQVGDTFSITPGCDKRVQTCIAFGLILNFGGEPYVKGQDGILIYPNAQ